MRIDTFHPTGHTTGHPGSHPVGLLPGPDHALLVAGAAVCQSSTKTAILAERIARSQPQSSDSPLATLLQLFGGADESGAEPSRGSFHPRVARAAAGKARSRLMKPGFTLAF